MSESIAESLSTIGLVAGFPLLLLCFMLSLEKLESWGLRDLDAGSEQTQTDKIEAAMDAVERLATAPSLRPTNPSTPPIQSLRTRPPADLPDTWAGHSESHL